MADLLAKKPTLLVFNSQGLIKPFCNLRCTGDHKHSNTAGRTKALQKYTMLIANRLIDGSLFELMCIFDVMDAVDV